MKLRIRIYATAAAGKGMIRKSPRMRWRHSGVFPDRRRGKGTFRKSRNRHADFMGISRILSDAPRRQSVCRGSGRRCRACRGDVLEAGAGGAACGIVAGGDQGRERIEVFGSTLYIVYPDGIGPSKLTHGMIEKYLATRGTARNWNTVLKLLAAAVVVD
jgi:uncharacterized protein (DUF1697 family)